MAKDNTTSGKLTIRPYLDGDRDALVALWQACDLNRPWNDPDQDIALFQGTPTSEIFVGKIGRQLIASVCMGHDGHRGWIYYLSVLPKLRARGHGTAILRHGEAWLAKQGVPKVQLIVRPENLGTRTFYARAGYEPNACRLMQRWLTDRGAPSLGRDRPDGRIPVTIIFLEMTERPPHPHVSPPAGLNCALMQVPRPSVHFYRYLYNGVGAQWLWFERRELDDGQLARIIHDERVDIYVLHVAGEPAGFAEIDRRKAPDVELAYFGLLPDFIGKGLGRYLLTWAIDTAWNSAPKRVWVNTNTLDHPKALPLYQRCGFRPYKQEQTVFDDPRLNGLIAD
ncbi:MAG: GNAT family acetyltransferase [Kiloniellales bacterium]